MTGLVLTLLGILGGVAALWIGLPPSHPDLWPLAIGLIVAGLCGLASTLVWCFTLIRKTKIEKGVIEK